MPVAAEQAAIASILSAIDQVRRSLADGEAPQAEIYLEGARGNMHHAREAILHARRRGGASWRHEADAVARLAIDASRSLCELDAPNGWIDERHPARPDLGADLAASAEARALAERWFGGGMLVAAIADHAWLHLPTGTSWSSDRSGALAIVGAIGGGRPVAHFGVEELGGSLEEGVVRLIASLGWRRLRSPRWEPAHVA